jgi:hypothetical protein
MKKGMQRGRWGLQWYSVMLVLSAFFISACSTVQNGSANNFKQGVTAAQAGSNALFQGLNTLSIDVQLDYAELQQKKDKPDRKLNNLELVPAVGVKSLYRWNKAFDALHLYASALETLEKQGDTVTIHTSLGLLGKRINALASDRSIDVTGIEEVGNIITRAAAAQKEVQIAKEADPVVQDMLKNMDEAITIQESTSRMTWNTVMQKSVNDYSDQEKKNKREIARKYMDLVKGQQTMELAFESLHQVIYELRHIHACIAQGTASDTSYSLRTLQEQCETAKKLIDATSTVKP